MSGGSMGYLYSKIEYAEFEVDTPERQAFAEHLKLVAKALHDIEWVDSGDYGPGDENKAIRDCLPIDDTALLRQALWALIWADTPTYLEQKSNAIITALRARLGEKA